MKRTQSLPQSAAEVEPGRAFEFWRDFISALSGIDILMQKETRSFAAQRIIASTTHSLLLHSKIDQAGVMPTSSHIRNDDDDSVSIAMFLRGDGYFEQGNREARMAPGDIRILDSNRLHQMEGYEAYEEVRLRVSRSVFRTHIGEPEAFAGRVISSSSHSALFANYLLAYARLAGQMSDAEADVAIEAGLHLLRSFITASEEPVSIEALRSLAMVHIERHLHDTSFGPEEICKSLCVSRTRLYAAFAGGEGIAESIRGARLDRAHRYLLDPAQAHVNIATIMMWCGFADQPSFSRAFRRRFGITAREVRSRRDNR